MASDDETKSKEPCWWCKPGAGSGPETLALAVGSGMFRDFDSDFSYGIPVCGGCGGLGYQYPEEDFKIKTTDIMNLRFEYCPTDGTEPSPIVKLAKLKELIAKVTELYMTYRPEQPEEECYAKMISEGCLEGIVERIKREEIWHYN